MIKLMRIFACLFSLLAGGFLSISAQIQDTVAISNKRLNNTYGLRLGLDLKKITQTVFDDNYTGFEIIGDYRLTPKIYFATELGREENNIKENSVSVTTKGNYIKAGVDYNVFKNLVGMRNLIYVGSRYGFANFYQQLNNFSIAQQNSFFPSEQLDGNLEQSSLNTHWLEFLGGIKVEVLDNLFLGFSVSVQYKFIEDTPEGFDNLYIPGFGTTNDFSEFSASFSYFISYYIPLYKGKAKSSRKEKNVTPKKNKK